MSDEMTKIDNVVTEPSMKLSEMDRMSLALAKANVDTAKATAEKFIAQHATAELNYRYAVMALYMKLGLDASDAIQEDGTILKGGAVNMQGQK